MDKEKMVFTLEKHKIAKMGPESIVVIPRKIIQYRIIDPKKLYNIHFEEVVEEKERK
ncbi:MAG: hypothetical protein ACTSPN_16045 [Promethearchaeota archaeon]